MQPPDPGVRPARAPLLAVALLAALVLVPRGLAITRAQSERTDDDFHLMRGVVFLRGELLDRTELKLNDPPLGAALTALPLWLAGCWRDSELRRTALFDHPCPAETILVAVGVWRSLLAVALVAVAFRWLARLYGARSAWLGAGLLLVEPTFAAHVPLPALDVLGVTAIVVACWLCWQAFAAPTVARLVAAALAVAVALLVKHTAVIVPAVAAGYAILWWGIGPWRAGRLRASWRGAARRRLAGLAFAAGVCGFSIWALSGFDVSRPDVPDDTRFPDLVQLLERQPRLGALLELELPAGIYVSSLLEAHKHANLGHPTFLFGQRSKTGWWYYFPAVATYKVPLGILALFALAAASLRFARPRFAEWSLLVPMLAATALLLGSRVQIGFRHFLPAYVFMLLLATRSLADGARLRPAWGRALLGGAWLCVGATALHAAWAYHPHYLSYLNYPRARPWLQISDSNLEWSHGLKEVRRWIDAHPDRAVAVRDFMLDPENVRRWVGERPTVLRRGDLPPTSGVLIVSGTAVTGQYEHDDPYRPLRRLEPDAVLAHAMLVYDLDRLRAQGTPVEWHGARAERARAAAAEPR